jgi:hypothetical protein
MPLRAFLTNRDHWALTALVLMAVLLPISFGKSEAAFVAGSNNPNSIFSSASSFNTVSVTLTNPGTPLRGTVILNAVATSDRPMNNVVFQTSPAGANTWTTACTDNATPFNCSLDTSGLADGLYDVRAVAGDTAGYSQTSTVTNRRIDNTAPTATTTDPGSPLTGTVSVSGTGSDGGSGVASTSVQYRPSGGGSWSTICTQSSATATCSWNTASLADGLYDLRTIATDVAGNTTTTSPIVANRRLDNIAPSATMTAPAANLNGTVTLASTSSDAANGTGVASVRYEYKPTSGSTWNTACTSSTTPFSCSFNTGSTIDGLYDFRAVAIDGVNLTGTSAAVTSRRIDNTAPGATMGALAANLSGSVSLTSTLIDGGSGVASGQYQYKLTSDSTWTNACSSSTTPYTCSFNTASVSDGLYDFRVVATDNVGNTGTSTAVFSRRIDNTNPTVTMGSVPAWVDASISLTSNPADDGGIASVQYQYKLSTSGTWLNACSSATTPFGCSFNTAALTNGSLYDFRVTATDNAGRTATSGTVQSRMDHVNPAVTLTAPAANLGGSVTLASSPTDANSGVADVQYQYKLSSSGTWLNACSASSTPWTCAFDISGLADGLYDFRVTATDNVGRTATSAASTGRRIDNTDPATATLNAVAATLSGTVAFGGTATDNAGGSGIATWALQYSPAGTNTWTTLCSDNGAPYNCNGNVDGIADGLYDFRALATDNAGNTRGSAVQTNRRIDTDGPVTSITSPANGTRVRGNVTMTAAATDPVGVTSVQFQVFYLGFWLTFCTDNTASYTCTGDSTGVPDGTYQTRVIATDTLGHTTTSSTISLIIDNTGPNASDVQAANGGTAGRIDAGDSITFTWSEPMAPASILAGWDGSATAARVFVDNNVQGNNDAIVIYNSTGATRLNLTSATALRLNANYVNNDVWLNGTVSMSGNNVVVSIGSLISGTINTGVTTQVDMDWYSSNAATDVVGNPASGNTDQESGAADRDF